MYEMHGRRNIIKEHERYNSSEMKMHLILLIYKDENKQKYKIVSKLSQVN